MDIEKYGVEYLQPHIIDDDVMRKLDEVKHRMSDHLSRDQSMMLQDALNNVFLGECDDVPNERYIDMFLNAKKISGCTDNTIRYYGSELVKFFNSICKPTRSITPNDVRQYLGSNMANGCSECTCNNQRRVLSSYFQWLENEDIIAKSPMRRVEKIKEIKLIKMPFSDIEVEKIRMACRTVRERMVVEVLNSSGMRVGELHKLNIEDINLNNHECIVTGKGKKMRKCFLSDVACMYAKQYIESRDDDCPALLVSEMKRDGALRRLEISGIEMMIREIGKRAGVEQCHPHRFRRTMASRNMKRGMQLEDIQSLLGHADPKTTLIYAIHNDEQIKNKARMLMD